MAPTRGTQLMRGAHQIYLLLFIIGTSTFAFAHPEPVALGGNFFISAAALGLALMQWPMMAHQKSQYFLLWYFFVVRSVYNFMHTTLKWDDWKNELHTKAWPWVLQSTPPTDDTLVTVYMAVRTGVVVLTPLLLAMERHRFRELGARISWISDMYGTWIFAGQFVSMPEIVALNFMGSTLFYLYVLKLEQTNSITGFLSDFQTMACSGWIRTEIEVEHPVSNVVVVSEACPTPKTTSTTLSRA